VLTSIETLGAVLGEAERGKQGGEWIAGRAKAIEEKWRIAKTNQCLYQVAAEPLYTAGQTLFVTT